MTVCRVSAMQNGVFFSSIRDQNSLGIEFCIIKKKFSSSLYAGDIWLTVIFKSYYYFVPVLFTLFCVSVLIFSSTDTVFPEDFDDLRVP